MSYSYLIDKTGLSSVLAQLLEPPPLPWTVTSRTAELAEESDLALTLRMLLAPESEQS